MTNHLLNRPIFIVGSGRSGTTLLQRMLGSHSRVSSPTGESHFFIPLYKNQNKYGDLSKVENVKKVLEEMRRISREFVEEDLHGIEFNSSQLAQEFVDNGYNTIISIINGLLSKNAYEEGKQRWLDKTPYYVLHIKTILEMFPDAQFIHIIRDGRDCALSMLERKFDLKIFNTYHAAYTWSKYVNAGQAAKSILPANSYFEIKYEDLISDPETNIVKICEYLGETFEPNVIHFKKSQDPNNKTPLLSKDLQSTNTGKWRAKMTDRQIKIFESLAGNTLVRCGYELSLPHPKINFFEWIASELHIKLCLFYCRHFLNKRK